MNGQPGVSAFPMPSPTRPNGTPFPSQPGPARPPSQPTQPFDIATIIAQLRARAGHAPSGQPSQPGQPSFPPRGPLPIFLGGPSFTPPPGQAGGMIGRGPIFPTNASAPSRVLGVPQGAVRSQLSRGARPGRSTAFHDYTGSSVGSESGHYARVKGFTS